MAVSKKSLFFRGRSNRKAGKYREAIKDFTNAIKKYKHFVGAHVERGICYFELKEYKKSYWDIYLAHKIEPFNIDALFYAGMILQALKKFRTAANYFTYLLETDPSHIEAIYQRGLCTMKSGFCYYALNDFKRAIDLSLYLRSTSNVLSPPRVNLQELRLHYDICIDVIRKDMESADGLPVLSPLESRDGDDRYTMQLGRHPKKDDRSFYQLLELPPLGIARNTADPFEDILHERCKIVEISPNHGPLCRSSSNTVELSFSYTLKEYVEMLKHSSFEVKVLFGQKEAKLANPFAFHASESNFVEFMKKSTPLVPEFITIGDVAMGS